MKQLFEEIYSECENRFYQAKCSRLLLHDDRKSNDGFVFNDEERKLFIDRNYHLFKSYIEERFKIACFSCSLAKMNNINNDRMSETKLVNGEGFYIKKFDLWVIKLNVELYRHISDSKIYFSAPTDIHFENRDEQISFPEKHKCIYVGWQALYSSYPSGLVTIKSLVNLLVDSFGEPDDSHFIKSLLLHYKRIEKIDQTTLLDLFRENNLPIIKRIVEEIYDGSEYPLSNYQINRMANYISKCRYAEDIARALYTYEYCLLDFNSYNDSSFFDLTFIAVSLFKIVEIVFYELLKDRWNEIEYRDENGKIKTIDLTNREIITLGDLEKVFFTTQKEIKDLIFYKPEKANQLKQLTKQWRKYYRNGYLHKDILKDENQVNESIQASLKMFSLLIEIFE